MMALVTTAPYVCQYCNHGYTRHTTLITHVCEQKRRAIAVQEKHVIIAFDAFNKFYKSTNPGTHDKTYADFCKSPYYNGFVKFGSFVNNVKPMYPYKFIDYVIKSGVKLDHWSRDALYDKYVVDLLRTENVVTALERSVTHMVEWADANNSVWDNYFLEVSLSRATYDIKDGKISPWLILNSSSGKALLQRFSDEQLNAIRFAIDPPFWLARFKRISVDIDLVKQVITESSL
jgi:hypothetical protein